MAATVAVQTGHGDPPGTWGDVSHVRFKSADNDISNTADPLVRPASGTNYSFEKWFRLLVTAPPVNNLVNLRFHRAAGTPSPGISDYYGERSQAEGYETPIGGSSAYATTAVPTEATLLTKNNGPFAGTGMYGPYVVIQWRVSPSAEPGVQNALTYRWTFDET